MTGVQTCALPISPALARRFTRGYLADAGADARCQQVGELLVSELVTNALVHAHSTARVGITLTDGIARVEVTDEAITYQPASRYWPWGCRAVPCASTEADTTTRSD